MYHIELMQEKTIAVSTAKIIVDGIEQHSPVITLINDSLQHEVTIVLENKNEIMKSIPVLREG